MAACSSLLTKFLDLPPSCIELCLWDTRLLAVGTYNLEKDAAPVDGSIQKRSGSILLFCIGETEEPEIKLIQTWPTEYAILDLHFPAPRGQAGAKSVERALWSANSTGSLTRFSVSEGDDGISKIANADVFQILTKDLLVLSFTIHPRDVNCLAVTVSDGSVLVLNLSADHKRVAHTLRLGESHKLEAWTVSFLGRDLILSGGDDASLLCHTVTPEQIPDASFHSGAEECTGSPSAVLRWKDRRSHTAGVTAILPLSENGDVFVTGSYDEKLRLFSLQGRAPRLLAEQSLGGGVWRLKLMAVEKESPDSSKYIILASCMHAGARIVEVSVTTAADSSVGSCPIIVLAQFIEHESMNYGSELASASRGWIISTSFYDRRLCLWAYKKLRTETSIHCEEPSESFLNDF